MALDPVLKEKMSAELVDTLGRVERLEEELKDETHERKEEIKQLKAVARELRLKLAGKVGVQSEIPGTEIPSVKSREPKGMDAALELVKRAPRGSKKFPLGLGLTERCTACGEEFGKHAGQLCPETDHWEPEGPRCPVLTGKGKACGSGARFDLIIDGEKVKVCALHLRRDPKRMQLAREVARG